MDQWLRRFAKNAQRDNTTRVHVLVDDGGAEGKLPILGYFALSMTSVELENLSAADRRRLPRYPVAAVLMTRLAVDVSLQGQGLGRSLLFKAAGKALLAAEFVAAVVFVVDAIDEKAAAFYARFDFVPCGDPLRLYIPMARLAGKLSGGE
jgi:ribosomal protein S18 acetylase RimI-like enzyme